MSGSGDRLTVRQKILVAAALLSAEAPTFPVERLILRAWNLFPESFSLRGYERQYPDSNRVLAKLAGTSGLRALGWIVALEDRQLQVTSRGHQTARPLLARHAAVRATAEQSPPPAEQSPPRPKSDASKRRARPAHGPTPASAVPLDVYEVQRVLRAARSPTWQKFMRGIALQSDDAQALWEIRDPASLVAQIEAFEATLLHAIQTFGGPKHEPSDPRLPPLTTCYGLLNLHRLLRTRFEPALTPGASSPGA